MLRTAGWVSKWDGSATPATISQRCLLSISLLHGFDDASGPGPGASGTKRTQPLGKGEQAKLGLQTHSMVVMPLSPTITCYLNLYDAHAIGHSPKAPSLNLKKPTFPESTTAMTIIFFPALSAANGLTTLERSLDASGAGKSQGNTR